MMEKNKTINRLLLTTIFLILCAHLSAVHSVSVVELQKRNNLELCGNGKLDPGEECDFSLSQSKDCCSYQCTRLPNTFTSCSNGQGVCQNGICITRSSQCSAFNGRILSVSSTLSVQGPYVPCNPAKSSQQPQNKSIPIDFGCQLSCGGQNTGNRSFTCLNLADYANIENQLPNGASCSINEQPGVCLNGKCDFDSCRRYKCNNNGNCVSNGNDKIVECVCEPPFSGLDCSISPKCDGKVDSCGVCNGDHSSCALKTDVLEFLKSNTFYYVVIPCASVGILLVAACITFFCVRRYKRNKQSGKSSLHPKNSQKSSTSTATTSSFVVLNSSAADKVDHRKQAAISTSTFATATSTGTNIAKELPNISVRFDEFKVIHEYVPAMPDELELKVGDVLLKLFEYDDGWAKGFNTRTEKEGVYPVGFTERVVNSVIIASTTPPPASAAVSDQSSSQQSPQPDAQHLLSPSTSQQPGDFHEELHHKLQKQLQKRKQELEQQQHHQLHQSDFHDTSSMPTDSSTHVTPIDSPADPSTPYP